MCYSSKFHVNPGEMCYNMNFIKEEIEHQKFKKVSFLLA